VSSLNAHDRPVVSIMSPESRLSSARAIIKAASADMTVSAR
jgi:hypothetical protein